MNRERDEAYEGFQIKSGRLPDDPSKLYEDPKPVHAIAYRIETEDVTGINAGAQDRQQHDCGHPPANNDTDEMDPLDAFMAEIAQIEQASAQRKRKFVELNEEVDHVAEYMQRRQQQQQPVNYMPSREKNYKAGDEDQNSDDEVYAAAAAVQDFHEDIPASNIKNSMAIEPLATLNHSDIYYEDFRKEFYTPVLEIAALDGNAIALKRKSLGIASVCTSTNAHLLIPPIDSFSQCTAFDAKLLKAIEKAGYASPTPIQAQAIPIILSGYDVIATAKTGSGKTAAFILPMMVHIMDQRELERGEGPIALVVAPTRELAEQIHRETRKFGKPYSLSICAAFGGLAKHQQIKELKSGCEVAVCTPGRMIDLIKAKACALTRCTYIVLDEADRMLDLGFEPQIRSLLGQIRPDRQTLLFSATMPRKVQRLISDTLNMPVRIAIGGIDGSSNAASYQQTTTNEDVKQIVHVFESETGKQQWLLNNLSDLIDQGDVIIFANQKAKVENIARIVTESGIAHVAVLHGDMCQAERMSALSSFRTEDTGIHVMIATDVAARGLDIKTVKTVVNYDAAGDIDTHIHRVGRTGRAGDTEGVAYTMLLAGETKAAWQLEQCLIAAGQPVSDALHKVAAKDPRYHHRKGNPKNRGGERHAPKLMSNGIGFADKSFQRNPTTLNAAKGGSDNFEQQQHNNTGVNNNPLLRSFVSSGHRHGDVDARPEIIMPPQAARQASTHKSDSIAAPKALPPPPVPVTERPLYMHRTLEHTRDTNREGHNSPGFSQQSEEVVRAIAQARAIAARLTQQQNRQQ